MLALASKRQCYERRLAEEEKVEIEKGVYFRLADFFEVDVDLIFYDTTSGHFEIDYQDPGGSGSGPQAGSLEDRADGCRTGGGGSGDDTRRFPPVRHWVFSGNTVDLSTVTEVK